ncbi:hypothetical protein COU77_03975 [Candidatus Peregrinibacteria bacterium CG10_big_fil_rev_8_21_14_0_10_49_16]|nr:MAG: hypothetical protein COW95_00960 [Candidatus Peregrinibacteria bacterium CG22_combo_CG10-13_8_21_14_all_49_11]PIR51770.1 MAG: hypothetical protein COU77_03975 [Candidatus Peregrinibacteria bacterium CG10_big_fil_rev_8_21_14_0_10_49_16]
MNYSSLLYTGVSSLALSLILSHNSAMIEGQASMPSEGITNRVYFDDQGSPAVSVSTDDEGSITGVSTFEITTDRDMQTTESPDLSVTTDDQGRHVFSDGVNTYHSSPDDRVEIDGQVFEIQENPDSGTVQLLEVLPPPPFATVDDACYQLLHELSHFDVDVWQESCIVELTAHNTTCRRVFDPEDAIVTLTQSSAIHLSTGGGCPFGWEKIIKSDINQDGSVDEQDAEHVRDVLEILRRPDVNRDGVIHEQDTERLRESVSVPVIEHGAGELTDPVYQDDTGDTGTTAEEYIIIRGQAKLKKSVSETLTERTPDDSQPETDYAPQLPWWQRVLRFFGW